MVAAPWLGCLFLLGGSAAFDAGTHVYSQLFQCPAYDRGTLVARPYLSLQLKMILSGLESGTPQRQMNYVKKSLQKNQFSLRGSYEAGMVFERVGKVPNEAVLIGSSLKNLPSVASLLGIAGELSSKLLNRSVRIVVYQDEALPLPELLSELKAVRASLELGSLTQFNSEKGSQSYPSLAGRFYPDQGNFLAFVAGNGGKSTTHVSSSLFRRYSHTRAQCFKQVGWVPSALETPTSPLKALGLPYVYISDTGESRTTHGTTIDLEQLSDITVGLAKVVEGFAIDSNPAEKIPADPLT